MVARGYTDYETLKGRIEGVLGLADIYVGGSATYGYDVAKGATGAAAGILPGMIGGTTTTTVANDSSESTLPLFIKLFIGFTLARTNIAIGGNEILELLYNLVNKSDFVFKYNSYGFFNTYTKINTGLFRIKNTDSNYLGQSFQSFDNGKYKINNLFRPTTVAVALDKNITEPTIIDTSRFTIGGDVNPNLTINTYSDNYLVTPSTKQIRPISAYYGALKFNFDNQYGQLDGIKQIQMRGCVEYLDPTKHNEFKYSS